MLNLQLEAVWIDVCPNEIVSKNLVHKIVSANWNKYLTNNYWYNRIVIVGFFFFFFWEHNIAWPYRNIIQFDLYKQRSISQVNQSNFQIKATKHSGLLHYNFFIAYFKFMRWINEISAHAINHTLQCFKILRTCHQAFQDKIHLTTVKCPQDKKILPCLDFHIFHQYTLV